MTYFTELGYIGLFLASFLAATIFPLSSEIVLSGLLLSKYDPTFLVAIATIGNVLGALVNYGVGFWGSKAIIQKVLKEYEYLQAEERFKKYGIVSLFFAWMPIIGDPLTVIAGILKVNILWFLILVTSGKLIRYIVISHIILYSM